MNETREILGKARYRDPSVRFNSKAESDTAEVIFEKSQRALTPGQVLAFYEGRDYWEEVLILQVHWQG